MSADPLPFTDSVWDEIGTFLMHVMSVHERVKIDLTHVDTIEQPTHRYAVSRAEDGLTITDSLNDLITWSSAPSQMARVVAATFERHSTQVWVRLSTARSTTRTDMRQLVESAPGLFNSFTMERLALLECIALSPDISTEDAHLSLRPLIARETFRHGLAAVSALSEADATASLISNLQDKLTIAKTRASNSRDSVQREEGTVSA